MIYDFTLLARKSGFDLSKGTHRRQLEQFAELVILDVLETLPEDQRCEALKKFKIHDPKATP